MKLIRKCDLELKLLVIGIESHGVTNEGDGFGGKTEFLEEGFGSHLLEIPTLVSLWVILFVFSNIFEEFTTSTLFQDSHKRRLESFSGSRWDLKMS